MLRVLHLLMEFKGYCYSVSTQVLLSQAEVISLMELSAGHYDGYCRSVGEVGGFIYGMHNAVCVFADGGDAPIPRLLSWREVDTLIKILEQWRTEAEGKLYIAMRSMLSDMSAEVRKANGSA